MKFIQFLQNKDFLIQPECLIFNYIQLPNYLYESVEG